MKIAIIGKFPPIQGGVSRRLATVAFELAGSRHDVRVITNATQDLPADYKQVLLPEDELALERELARRDARLFRCGPKTWDVIPAASHVSLRLYGRALEALADDPPDLLIGWYMVPYGIIASQVAAALGVRYALIHAGSDIGTLAEHPELAAAYRPAFANATAIITENWSVLHDRLTSVGAPRSKLVNAVGRVGDLEQFVSEPYEAAAYQPFVGRWLEQLGIDAPLQRIFRAASERPLPPTPRVGYVGKLAEFKGPFALVDALSKLAADGYSFHFCVLPTGRRSLVQRLLERIATSPRLLERTWVLPPIAPWRMTSFLASCAAVPVLSQDDPVNHHSPQVWREVLAAGAPLLITRWAIERCALRRVARDRHNLLVVEDRDDTGAAALRIAEVLEDESLRRRMATNGPLVAEAFQRILSRGEARDGIAAAIHSVCQG